jgi:NADH:ubiquinone oxidoreductase subunit 5 (subunit L)/multisubunit Na+/H+ antiporter MnhA subunit
MLLSTSRQVRLAVVTLVVIAAILMIAVIPFIGFDMVNPIVTAQQARIEKFTAEGNPQAPLLELTVWLVSFFYPFWSTLSPAGGHSRRRQRSIALAVKRNCTTPWRSTPD